MSVFIGATKSNKIIIEKINYFGKETESDEYNAKVLYKKGNKLYLAIVWIDYFWKRVYIPKQRKYEKALVGLEEALVNELNLQKWR